MSTTPVTLDTIRAAAEAKYGAYPIALSETEIVRLLNPLRLSKEKRAELSAIQGELSGVDADDTAAVAEVDQVDIFRRMILCVAENAKLAQKLLDLVGDDLAVLAEIVSGYSDGTQVGEASASAA